MEEIRNKVLAENIRAEIEQHSSVEPGHLMSRINRVPDHVRSVHPQAYTPRVVSIGPIHHFDEKLQNMEKQKFEYLNSFLGRVDIELEMFVVAIRDKEGSIRRRYGETSFDSMESDDFVKMILLDAIFILELFCRYIDDSWGGDESDPLQMNQWMFSFVRLDLVLLENQLPFVVLELLFNVAFVNDSNSQDLIKFTFYFFSDYNVHFMDTGNVIIEHFTGLVRAFQVQPVPLREWSGRLMVKRWYSATALHDAGVKFEQGVDLHYENGVLTMPLLVLDYQMEAVVRNVMALEQFCCWDGEFFTDNFIFLGFLVNTIEDINLLCDRKILINKLVDRKAVLSMVKNLVPNVVDLPVSYYISEICQALSEFYNMPYNRWKARLSVTMLKNQYFSNPWRGAGTVAACLLLLLSLIQTIMSILQVAMA